VLHAAHHAGEAAKLHTDAHGGPIAEGAAAHEEE
jgi:hypothetical protein